MQIAKSFHLGQPARTAQAEQGRHFAISRRSFSHDINIYIYINFYLQLPDEEEILSSPEHSEPGSGGEASSAAESGSEEEN